MPVMVLFFAHRDHASVRHFALHMLELNRGVVDAEFFVQSFLHITQNSLAD